MICGFCKRPIERDSMNQYHGEFDPWVGAVHSGCRAELIDQRHAVRQIEDADKLAQNRKES